MGSILENPIVVREWRGLGRRLRDWRLWIGLRMPREPAEWGLPAIAWFGIAPYLAWVLLLILHRVDPLLIPSSGVDLFAVILLGLAFYACVVSVTAGALTISRERERETWDQLRVTRLEPGELVIGYWYARTVPIAIGIGASVVVWLALYPHYRALLEPLGPFDLKQIELLLFGLRLIVQVAALCAVGLLMSACCTRSVVAIVAAFGLGMLLAGFELSATTFTAHPTDAWLRTIIGFVFYSSASHIALGAASLGTDGTDRDRREIPVGLEAEGETA